MPLCPLCHNKQTDSFYLDKKSRYSRCGQCHLIFLDPAQRLSMEDEKKIYDLHQNNPHDKNYRKHLNKLVQPMAEHITKNMVGLDFGSGPGPTLSLMLRERGHEMNIYDAIYATDKKTISSPDFYDFITMTEVIEHIYDPHATLLHIWSLLKPKGYLGIMTSFYDEQLDFGSWHYKNDPTHICFYSEKCFLWFAKTYKARLLLLQDNIVILQKQ